MKRFQLRQWAVLALVTVVYGCAVAQPAKSDLGQREYQNNCAACHGIAGKGDGSFNELLTRRASDLSTLAKRNNGVFPVTRMYEVIDGAGVGHGSRDMPVFGMEYKIKAAEYYGELPYNPDAFVRMRIMALIEYLDRLQVK